eukprot:1856142-Amphidinium_carterae.1
MFLVGALADPHAPQVAGRECALAAACYVQLNVDVAGERQECDMVRRDNTSVAVRTLYAMLLYGMQQ